MQEDEDTVGNHRTKNDADSVFFRFAIGVNGYHMCGTHTFVETQTFEIENPTACPEPFGCETSKFDVNYKQPAYAS